MDERASPTDKRSWRRVMRSRRARIDRADWSARLVAALRAWTGYQDAATVATFLAFGSEPDLAALHGDGARFCVPRVGDPAGVLTLHPIGGRLERHRMGMLEPVEGAPRVDPDELDLAIVPGLAFDRTGVRIGYGGGHYDRLLARLPPGVPCVGTAHPDLLLDALPCEPHDVRLTHLALPDGVIAVRAPSDVTACVGAADASPS